MPIYNDSNIKTKNDDIECKSFTVISICSLLVYENRYYMQGYLDNCAYKITNKQMEDYLDESVCEDKIL